MFSLKLNRAYTDAGLQIWIMYFLRVECHAISALFKPQRSTGGELIRIFQSPRFTFLKLVSKMKLVVSNLHVCNHTMKNLSDLSFWSWNLWGKTRCSGKWWCCFGVPWHTANSEINLRWGVGGTVLLYVCEQGWEKPLDLTNEAEALFSSLFISILSFFSCVYLFFTLCMRNCGVFTWVYALSHRKGKQFCPLNEPSSDLII